MSRCGCRPLPPVVLPVYPQYPFVLSTDPLLPTLDGFPSRSPCPPPLPEGSCPMEGDTKASLTVVESGWVGRSPHLLSLYSGARLRFGGGTVFGSTLVYLDRFAFWPVPTRVALGSSRPTPLVGDPDTGVKETDDGLVLGSGKGSLRNVYPRTRSGPLLLVPPSLRPHFPPWSDRPLGSPGRRARRAPTPSPSPSKWSRGLSNKYSGVVAEVKFTITPPRTESTGRRRGWGSGLYSCQTRPRFQVPQIIPQPSLFWVLRGPVGVTRGRTLLGRTERDQERPVSDRFVRRRSSPHPSSTPGRPSG